MPESFNILATDGLFHQKIDDFTPRRAQQEMAQAVEDALTFSGRLVVESGTGTGKTYAYLVPAVLSGKRTIISTGTKHLQEQIFNRDLPVVLDVLKASVNAQLLKGRSNYLCRYRLNQNNQQTDLIGKQNKIEFDLIDKWAVTTKIGDIAEVANVNEDAPVWRKVTSTAENCLGGKCRDYGNCFVVKARQRAMKADIVVVNHHLFFSDLTLKTEGFGELLPDHEAVIFDEAHSIPEIASRFFGFSVSSFQFRELARDIRNAEREEKSAVEFNPGLKNYEQQIDNFQEYLKVSKINSEIISSLKSNKFDGIVNELVLSLTELENALALAAPAGEGLDKCFHRCTYLQGQLDSWLENRDNNAVCWLESRRDWFRLHMTPINPGDHFSKYLELPGMSWIFTSATLAVGDDFKAFCNEIGLEDTDTVRWDSPYDFQNNAMLYLPSDFPDPRENGFAETLLHTIRDVTQASNGRAFCLFTSHNMMEAVFKMLKDNFEWPLFIQGQAAKQKLLTQFLESDHGVLLGTASFWEGVDVKGESLSCVIIDKLPFASPSDPVLKSKLKQVEEQGGNPFMDVQIPSAVIALKQGVGRLIRSETDRGILVICDPRITTSRYGNLFIKSLPSMPITHSLSEVHQFFNRAQ